MRKGEKKVLLGQIARMGSLFVLLSVSLVLFFNTTLGWFSSNKKTSNSGMGLTVPELSNMTTISCYSLHYDGIYGAVCQTIEDGTEVAMSEYDRIFLDRNVNTPLIFRVVAGGVPNDENGYITINIPCNESFAELNGVDSNNGSDAAGVYIKQFLSNVVSVKVGCGLMINSNFTYDNFVPVATTERREPDNIAIFEGVRDAIHDATYAQRYKSGSFATASVNVSSNPFTVTYAKSRTISLRIDYEDYADFLYAPASAEDLSPEHGNYSAAGGDCLVLNLVFDYDDSLIEAFSTLSNIEETITFANDIGTIFIQEGGV